MAHNKVVLGNETLIDLSGDSVTEDTLADGVTAHNADGELITGRMKSNEPFKVRSGSCGTNATWEFYSDGAFYIKGTGQTLSFSDMTTARQAEWDDLRTDIKSVHIESGITSIGDWLLAYLSNATSVSIPDTVVSIAGAAFAYCESLEAIEIPYGVTKIESNAFVHCSSLAKITIPNSVKRIQPAFSDCTALKSVFYIGKKSEWDAIDINSGNEYLLKASLFCEYDDDTVGGWHFAVIDDGTPPASVAANTLVFVYNKNGG